MVLGVPHLPPGDGWGRLPLLDPLMGLIQYLGTPPGCRSHPVMWFLLAFDLARPQIVSSPWTLDGVLLQLWRTVDV